MTSNIASKQALVQEIEFRRARDSFAYFFLEFWKVQVPKKGPRKPEHRQFQQDLAAMLEEEQAADDQLRLVALKARQIGFTTVVAAYAAWSSLFGEDVPWLFVSRGENEAKKNLARASYGYRRLPKWMKDRLPPLVSESTERLAWKNESRIDSIPASASSGRGDSVYGVLFDEAAHMENPEELFGSLDPLCYGPMLVFSSANGMGNWFHNLWKEAQMPDSEWRELFCSWREVPKRDDTWYARTKRRYRGQMWMFYQEYPSTPQEAFAKTGRRAIGDDVLDDTQMREPDWRFEWTGDEFDVAHPLDADADEEPLELRVWYKPTVERDERTGVALRKPNYVVFCDPAEGLAHGDYTAVTVWDANTLTVVATIHTHWPVEELGVVLAWLGYYYHTALMMPERNNMGLVPIVELTKNLGYPRMYRMEQIGQVILGDRTPRFGWFTNKATKPKMVKEFIKAARAGLVTIHEPRFFYEVATFIMDGRGGYAASKNNHDDMVIAVLGGYQGVCDVGEYPIIWHDEVQGPPTWGEVLALEDPSPKKLSSSSLRVGGDRRFGGERVRPTITLGPRPER